MPCLRCRLLLAFAAVLLLAAPARAQQDRSFSPEIFHPAPGPDEFITVEPARVLRHKAYGVGLYFNYARDPFSILGFDNGQMKTSSTRADLIGNAFSADLWAAFGLWNRFQIALAIPMTLYQSGNDFV